MWSNGNICSNAYAGVTINNLVGGVFDVQENNSLTYGTETANDVETFNNAGTFRKSNGSGTTTVAWPWNFSNTGIVQVQSGTLSFAGAFSNSGTASAGSGTALIFAGGGTHSGTFNVSSGGSLWFTAGTHTFNNASFTNSGTINFSGGVLNFSGTSPSTVTGASTFSGGWIDAGAVTFSGLTWTGGIVAGDGSSLTIGVAAGGSLIIAGSGAKNFGQTDYTRSWPTLSNSGAITWLGGNICSNAYTVVTINNLVGGLFDLQGDNSLTYGTENANDSDSFNNAGTFRKSNGSGTSTISWPWNFNNTGTVQVQKGMLSIAGGVAQLPGSTLTGGTWIVSGSSTLSIATGSNITTNQGSITLDGPGSTFAKINTLANNQGTFTITDERNFTTVGGLANSGTINVGNGSTLAVSGNLNQTAGNLWLDNGGTLTAGNVAIAGGSLSTGGPSAHRRERSLQQSCQQLFPGPDRRKREQPRPQQPCGCPDPERQRQLHRRHDHQRRYAVRDELPRPARRDELDRRRRRDAHFRPLAAAASGEIPSGEASSGAVVTAIPEPGTLALLSVAGIAAAAAAWRRRRN